MPTIFGKKYAREELLRRVGHVQQIGGVQLLCSDDGPSRGVRLLEFRTGTGFSFKVCVDRGMDVGYCEYRGASLAWIPPTLLPGPWFFEQQTDFGWLRSALGGFCNTCGLVHIGNPETDSVVHYNFPVRPEERYGVHDRVAMLPGQLVRYEERWEGDECILEAQGRLVQAQAYGENLVMTRTYRAKLGESRYFLHDEVTNAGFLPTVHMLLYHINVGFPFVDENSELLAPTTGPTPLSVGKIQQDTSMYKRFVTPQKDCILEGYELPMIACDDGQVRVALVNPNLGDGGQAVYVQYNRNQLPAYLEWRMMGEGQYAVGMEPCTNSFGRQQVRERGQLTVLEPGETRNYELEIGVLSGREEIGNFRATVHEMAGTEMKSDRK